MATANATMTMSEQFDPGRHVTDEHCWTHESADRCAILVDGSNCFGAIREALLAAKESVFILGWDLDSRTRVTGDDREPDDGAPVELCDLLDHIVSQSPELRVRLLLWDFSMLYTVEREVLPQFALGWKTPDRVDVCLDNELPVGASHHHKLIVIDDKIAFIGGLDLTIRRWDTPAHAPSDPRRVDPNGEAYDPFHDIHAVIDGAVARRLGEFCRRRWKAASGEDVAVKEIDGDPWPPSVTPQFEHLDAGIARTVAEYDKEAGCREVEASYLAAIGAAEQFIYIENQYVTSDTIANAIIDRMRAKPGLHVAVICNIAPGGWLEAKTMGAGLERFMKRFDESGMAERIRFLEPRVRDDEDDVAIKVHSKLMIVDDRILHLGSANLNNRSLGLDTECNLVIECTSERDRRIMAELRNGLLAEHTGCESASLQDLFTGGANISERLSKMAANGRRLVTIPKDLGYDDEIARSINTIADPERPLDPSDFISDAFGGKAVSLLHRRYKTIGLAVLVIATSIAVWNFTPLGDYADPELLAEQLDSTRNNVSAALLMLVVFVVGGLFFFPVTVLIATSGIVLGPALGFATGLTGTILSAAATFLAGKKMSRWLKDIISPELRRKIESALDDRAVLGVAIIRNIPIAPYTAVNLLAANSGIRMAPFLLGTAIGMAPGTLMLTVMGDRLREISMNPTVGNVIGVIVAIAAWVVVALALQKLANRMRGKRHVA